MGNEEQIEKIAWISRNAAWIGWREAGYWLITPNPHSRSQVGATDNTYVMPIPQ